ncbi:MAG: MTH938/NDUFAF3 family protein [Woeseiaceae bacterium]
MKFALETGQNILIHGYEAGYISITGIDAEHPELKSGVIDEWDGDNHLGLLKKSISIRTNGDIKVWAPQTFADFIPAHFVDFANENAEIVILGTGKQLRFPSQDCLSALQQNSVGYEVMDTAAACRTFNVLVAEGRDVILAMLMIEKD